MPEFVYTARNASGQKVNGRVSAASQNEALSILTGESLFPLKMEAAKQASQGLRLFAGVNGQTLAVTYTQMASLLRSGVPLLKSLRILRDQTSNKILGEVIDDIHRRVEDGATLADAMGRHRGVFDEMATNMVRAGGEGGFLEEALERVAKFTEDYEDLKSRTSGALAYPVFLGMVGTLVVGGLIIFFVPQFAKMFDRLRSRGELPAMTELLLWMSDTLRAWWLPLTAVMIVAGVFAWMRLRTPAGKRWSDHWKLRLPMVGSIFQNLAVARFCRVLGTMLKNGVPILKSLDVSREAAGNSVLSAAIAKASENISSGESLAAPLATSGYFPRVVVEMIAISEESNTLDAVLVEIADGLERRTQRRLDLFVKLLEPMMLMVLAGVVLFVVVALLMPVIKMSSSLG